ncbi:MAG TPA: flagellin [Candidatus Baltobacteraceae bacterium]|nr:flagellin [Candidatus Baltobacteraceae bacterium]
MDVLGSTGQVELNLSRTQLDEERQTRALASGLRVITAADDPSGMAIAENIQTQVLGLQQGVQNVQTANNLLAVADSTLANVQQILQRIHGLIVQAASDLNSASDLESIQNEINTLLIEVNKISSNANFNGIKLFNGSLGGYTSPFPTVQEVTSPALPDGSMPTGTQVVNWDGLSGQAGNLVSSDIAPSATSLPRVDTTNSISSFITIRVIGYSANAIDPDTNTAVGPGDYVQIVAYSTDSKMGTAPEYTDTQAVPIGSGVLSGLTIQTPSGMNNLLDISLANLTAADVGTSMSFLTNGAASALPATQGTPLQVNSTGNEGGEIQIALPTLSTGALNLTGITVLSNNVENYLGQVTGTDSNQTAAADAQLRVQAALDSISTVRAQVGAQSISLQEDANDASVQIVNQTASESAIRDLNIGQAVTQFTQDQIMTQVSTSVLAQMHANAQLIIQLVNGLNPGVGGKL